MLGGGGELLLFWGKSNIKFSLHQNLTPRVITSKHIMVVWGLFCFAKIVIKKNETKFVYIFTFCLCGSW
jgi:hypothetical protein